jgi:DNA polymerase-1
MADTEKKLFLLDGMALAYRSHFALIRNPRTTSTGMNTSMPFIFTTTLLDLWSKQQPTHMAVAFDTGPPKARLEMFPDYKAQRESMPEDIRSGLPYVFRIVEGFNLPVLRIPDVEADDVIGTVAKQAEKEGFTTYMVTPDKDFAQLVTEKTHLYRPGRSGGDAEIHGIPEVLEKWGIQRVDQVIDILGLMGDASDNIPGVPGVGEKTAQKLIAEYDNVENLLENIDKLKGKQKERFEEHRDLAELSKKLVIIDTDVEMDINFDEYKIREQNVDALKELFEELEFQVLGKRVFGETFEVVPQQTLAFGDDAPVKKLADVKHMYDIADSPEKRAKLIDQLKKQKAFCMDIETSALSVKDSDIVGIAFCMKPHTGTYVPIPDDQAEAVAILEEFRSVLEDPKIGTIGHNLKYDLLVMRWHGIRVGGPVFDTMLAAHLTEPDMRINMDFLAQAILGYKPKPISELIGEKGSEQISMREVPVEAAAEYASEDADITLQLWEKLEPRIKEEKQEDVFGNVESPLLPVLVDMQFEGIRLDKAVLKELADGLQNEIDQTRERIFELAGEPFNLNSPKQLGEMFFETLKLDPNAKRTSKSKQYATNERVLTRLSNRHEIAAQVLHYRESTKLKSTYVDSLPDAVFEKTGHIHTNYEQAVTATGRMQSSNPNLQNIPVRSDQGREIRKAFVPRDDNHVLLAADYSQIELRIVADISKDAAMRTAFEEGADIHETTSMRVFHVDQDGVTPEMRRRAKMVNFGIIYGISAFGLSDRLDIPRGEAKDLIDGYLSTYPGIRDYMDATVEFAREHGYVETITGRRRFLRDITSLNATTRNAAERNAINSPIQGSAADMIKIAMAKIHNRMREAELKSRMLLQVHDELVFDMHKDEADVLPPLVEEEMMGAIKLEVPIVVELGVGDNWLEAH